MNQFGDIIFEDSYGEIDDLGEEDLPYDLEESHLALKDHNVPVILHTALDLLLHTQTIPPLQNAPSHAPTADPVTDSPSRQYEIPHRRDGAQCRCGCVQPL